LLAEARTVAAELVAKLPPPGDDEPAPLSSMFDDEWRASLAEQILRFEGSPV
jgi:hypothetical protein